MKIQSMLANVPVGDGHPVRLMGVINVSPESFYKGSIPKNERALAMLAEKMERDGADFIDVGAMSTAPYLKTQISEIEEAQRLAWAVPIIRKNCALPVSIDSYRSRPARAGLEAGGKILNDVTGFFGDPKMPAVARSTEGVILMAHPRGKTPASSKNPTQTAEFLLRRSLKIAERNQIAHSKIVIDPGIGFFRDEKISWLEWDLHLLHHLEKLRRLKRPVLIGVSRKSFIGTLIGEKNPENRLAGSLTATAIAVLNGASLVRTHDVKATKETVRAAENFRR